MSTDISARQGRICFVECLRKWTLCQPDTAVHKAFPLTEQTVVYLSFLFFSHLASLTHTQQHSVCKDTRKKEKKKKLWEDKKQNKEKGEHSDQMNNLVGHTF